MIGSDEDEAEDSVSDLPRPPLKKMRWDFEGMATDPENFISFLSKIGFQLRFDDQPNVLSIQGSVFQQTLREHLTSKNHGPKSVDIFVSGCDAFFGQSENFIKALQPTEESFDLLFDKGFSSSFGAEPKQSLIHLLLDITEVQPKLMQCLLERFTVAWEEENLRAEKNLPSLILSELTGLNRIVNPFYLAHVLLDALYSASPATPHLLTTAILKVFGELVLPPKDAAELRSKTIQRFLNVPFESIPALMAFVFNHDSSEESAGLIRRVRRHFDQAFGRERKRRNLHSHLAFRKNQLRRILLDEKYIDCLVLAVESIHESMKNSKDLADIWMEEIQEGPAHYIDLLVLLKEYKKYPVRIEQLFLEMLRSKSMPADFFKEAFMLYDLVLDNYFHQLRAVADSFLFSKDPMVIPCGSLLYLGWFSHADVTDQQKIVECLVRFISDKGGGASKAGREAEGQLTAHFSALNCVSNLEFMDLPAVKIVIDLIIKMVYGTWDASLSQNKSWFSVYNESDLSFIFQLLESSIAAIKRIGVNFAVSLLTVLFDTFVGGAVLVGEPPSSLSQIRRIQLAQNCVHLFQGCTEQPPEVAAFFLNEMTRSRLNEISEMFLNSFVVDEDEQPLSAFPVKLTLQLGLHILDADESGNKPLFLNIAPMSFDESDCLSRDRYSTKASITTLVSHFQLLRTIDNEGTTVRITDALLGCPLCLPDDDVLDDCVFDSLAQPVKDAVCRSLYHAVHWLIEVINTFASAKPVRSKVIQRIRDVILLKNKYYHCLAQNPEPAVLVGESFALLSPDQRLQLSQNLLNFVQHCTGPDIEVPAHLFIDEMSRPSTLEQMHPVLRAYLYGGVADTLHNMTINEAHQTAGDQSGCETLITKNKSNFVSTLVTNFKEKAQSVGLKEICDYFIIKGSTRDRMDKTEEQLIAQGANAHIGAAAAFITVMLDDICYLLRGCTGPVTEVSALVANEMARPSTLEEVHPVLKARLYDDVLNTLQNAFVPNEEAQLKLRFGKDTVVRDQSNIHAVKINEALTTGDRSSKGFTTKRKNDVLLTLKTNLQEQKAQSVGLKKACDHSCIKRSIRERMDKVEEHLLGQGADADSAAASAFTSVILDDVCYLLKLPKQEILHAMSINRN